jgi:hypothetical protein
VAFSPPIAKKRSRAADEEEQKTFYSQMSILLPTNKHPNVRLESVDSKGY